MKELDDRELIRLYNEKSDFYFSKIFFFTSLLLGIGTGYLITLFISSQIGIWIYFVTSLLWIIIWVYFASKFSNIYSHELSKRISQFRERFLYENIEDEYLLFEMSALPRGNNSEMTLNLNTGTLTVFDSPSVYSLLVFNMEGDLEKAYEYKQFNVNESDLKEIVGLIENIPIDGRKNVQSEVMDGAPCKLKIYRSGKEYLYSCNFAGIPSKNKADKEVQIINILLKTIEGGLDLNGMGSCDKEGNVKVY